MCITPATFSVHLGRVQSAYAAFIELGPMSNMYDIIGFVIFVFISVFLFRWLNYGSRIIVIFALLSRWLFSCGSSKVQVIDSGGCD